jgi:KUP system potassium uptake protein
VEGLELAAPGLERFVIPITLVILASLFAIQRFGTQVVGRLFGPVMALWFGTLAVLGLIKVVGDPSILRALSPSYGLRFFLEDGHRAFLSLGSIVLAVTGAEALYADMGHFGRPPIRRAWFLLVLPALVLNYMGQGALLLQDPKAVESPLFRLVPDAGLVPMVVLATLATVIASQAVISGAFSVTRQAVQLGFLPTLTIRHTSREEAGQIYVPVVNWGLFVAIVGLVVGFGSSSALASAYGIAVTGTLAIDTVLFFVVVHLLWKKSLALALAGAAAFLVVDLAFLAANVSKVLSGGWFPLVIAALLFTVLMTWRRGRDAVSRTRAQEEGPLLDFVLGLQDAAKPPVRVQGTAVFLNADPSRTPLALRYNVEHNRVLHEHVVVVSVETAGVPHVPEDEQVSVDDLAIPDDGIALVAVRYGFQDEPDVPRALVLAGAHGLEVDVDEATYFLSRVTIAPTRTRGMARWRKRMFTLMSRNAAGRVQYFCLPPDRVVSFGSQIEV